MLSDFRKSRRRDRPFAAEGFGTSRWQVSDDATLVGPAAARVFTTSRLRVFRTAGDAAAEAGHARHMMPPVTDTARSWKRLSTMLKTAGGANCPTPLTHTPLISLRSHR